jgi:hypothetical protein
MLKYKALVLDPPISVNDYPRAIWIPEYHRKPYLRSLTNMQLQARVEHIASNCFVLGDDGKYRLRFIVKDGFYRPVRNLDFTRMMVHSWEELRMRGNPPFDPFLRDKNLQLAKRLTDESWCSRNDWIRNSRLSQTQYEIPRMLFKFSQTKFNRQLFESGQLFLRPASAYNDASLNNALLDDELVRTWYSESGVLRKFSVSDYHCACFSGTFDLRLFRDFRENEFSCVAIRDVAEFIRRIEISIEKHNTRNPKNKISMMQPSTVLYYDPFWLEDMTIPFEGYFSKHFRFAYQEEFRLIAIPAHSDPLQSFVLNVGSLRDISEFIFDPTSREL